MEVVLIALMLMLVFKTAIIESLNKHFPTISSNAEPLIKYFGSSAILAMILALLPSLCMIIYMRSEGFFAYEIFSNQSYAFSVLFGNIFANFLVFSIGFFGAVVLLPTKPGKWMIFFVSLFNALFIYYFSLFAYIENRIALGITILVVTLLIAGYLHFWLSSGLAGKAKYWYAPLILATVVLLAPIVFPKESAELTAGALAQMRVGGMNVLVSDPKQIISPQDGGKVRSFWLVLRTSDALYLKETRESTNVTVLKAEGFTVTPSVRPN